MIMPSEDISLVVFVVQPKIKRKGTYLRYCGVDEKEAMSIRQPPTYESTMV
jgi:hypothetical protein